MTIHNRMKRLESVNLEDMNEYVFEEEGGDLCEEDAFEEDLFDAVSSSVEKKKKVGEEEVEEEEEQECSSSLPRRRPLLLLLLLD